jgi:pimeloyl-ACP methyl ester carboxylesterase
MRAYFSHGKESGPWGTKIRALAEVARNLDWSVESLDYQGIDDPEARVGKLLDWCRGQTSPVVLVGSSMGGHVAAVAATRWPAVALFLLAPAFYVPGYEDRVPEPPKCPIAIVHGWRDEVIPWSGSVRFASQCAARLLLIDGDHRLTAALPEIAVFFREFLREFDHVA